MSQHLDREVFIRLNTSWSRCSYIVYEQCVNVNTDALFANECEVAQKPREGQCYHLAVRAGLPAPVARQKAAPIHAGAPFARIIIKGKRPRDRHSFGK